MKRPIALKVYIGAVAAAGLALAAYLLFRYPPQPEAKSWLLMLAMTAIGVGSVFPVLRFSPGVHYEINTIPFFASILIFPPGSAMLVVCLATILGARLRRTPLIQLLFNTGQIFLYCGTASFVFTRLGQPFMNASGQLSTGAIILTALSMVLVNLILVAGVVSIQKSTSLIRVARTLARHGLLPELVMCSLGLLTAMLVNRYAWGGLLLILSPALALFLTLKRVRASEERQAVLTEQNRQLVESLQAQKNELQQTVARLETALQDNLRINQWLETEVVQREQAEEQVISAYDDTLEALSRALELRDQETEGHCQQVTFLTMRLVAKMGIPQNQWADIRRGALLHDIGKLGIPDAILLKPGPLTEREWQVMRRHPIYAYEILSSIEFLRPALDIPYCHHERWDGTGYPRRLKGLEIPLVARMFAVADVWDALRSNRPYRPAWSDAQARDYLINQSGIQFDPQVVQVFLELVQDSAAPAPHAAMLPKYSEKT